MCEQNTKQQNAQMRQTGCSRAKTAVKCTHPQSLTKSLPAGDKVLRGLREGGLRILVKEWGKPRKCDYVDASGCARA